MPDRDIVVIVGSLRRESLNRRFAQVVIRLAPPTLKMQFVEIGELPLYNPDREVPEAPAEWTAFRQRIVAADAILFVTPEHNRSMPAAMKNAVDVGSRPSGKNVWHGKPGAVMSASPGNIGGFGAHHHLRQSLVGVGLVTMPGPEVYLSNAGTLIDAAGQLTNDRTRDVLTRFVAAFERWVETIAPR